VGWQSPRRVLPGGEQQRYPTEIIISGRGVGVGHIYCPSGHYCEDTIKDPMLCRSGHYCRVGSVSPSRCAPMMVCDSGTSLPDDYFGLAFDGFMFVLLALVFQASKYYNRILRRFSARERIRIHWGMDPRWDIVPMNEIGSPAGNPDWNSSSGMRRDSPFRPRLISLPLISSLSRTFSRNSSENGAGGSRAQPAVWATLTQEMSSLDQSVLRTEMPPDEGSSSTSHSVTAADMNPQTVSIEFFSLNLKVRSDGALIVRGASGKFETAKLTVVMGPSGCGEFTYVGFCAKPLKEKPLC